MQNKVTQTLLFIPSFAIVGVTLACLEETYQGPVSLASTEAARRAANLPCDEETT
jgi:hypothetical protein